MNYDPILVVSGEPNSVFLEIFFKILKKKKIKNPLILISSEKILKLQMNKLRFKKDIRILNVLKLDKYKLNNKSINLLNVDYRNLRAFEKITSKSNSYIKGSFDLAFRILKKGKIKKLINGPISKKYFLNNKYPGMTELISSQFSKKKPACLFIIKN